MTSFDPRIVALTGSAAEINAAARAFDAYYEKVESTTGDANFDHTAKTYLMDREGRLAGAVDLQSSEADRRKLLARLLASQTSAQ